MLTERQRIFNELAKRADRLNSVADVCLDEIARLRAEIERLTQKNADLHEKLHDESAQHVRFMLHDHPKALAARDAAIAQQAERIAELEKECGSNLRMFQAAILDLASISESLDCDPDDGGPAPIIEAIDELKARIAELEAKLPEIARNIEAGKAENAAQSAALAKARGALEVALETDQLLGGLWEERANEALAAIAAHKKGGAQ